MAKQLAAAAPRLGDALPVRQPGQRPGALRTAPARSCCATCPTITHFVAGPGHHRHADGHRALPAGEGPDVQIVAAEPRYGELVYGLRNIDEGFVPELYDAVGAHPPVLGRPPTTRCAAPASWSRTRASSPASPPARSCTPRWRSRTEGRGHGGARPTSRSSSATAAGSTCRPAPTPARCDEPPSASRASSGRERRVELPASASRGECGDRGADQLPLPVEPVGLAGRELDRDGDRRRVAVLGQLPGEVDVRDLAGHDHPPRAVVGAQALRHREVRVALVPDRVVARRRHLDRLDALPPFGEAARVEQQLPDVFDGRGCAAGQREPGHAVLQFRQLGR